MSATSMTGRDVLVTGAGGFVGGHLAARLVADGARVRAFVRYNSRADRGALEWLDPVLLAEIDVVMGDLRDAESVARAVRGSELVFHLGAQVAIPYSYVNARDFFETNVLGTLNVAEAALTHAVEHLVHTSTSEVYGTAQTVPIREDHPLGAQSPYAASKVGADKLMETFHRAHGLRVTVLRPFNTFGPHQSARAIVPTIVSQALASDTLHLGALTPRRDLTYVSDTVAGFVAAASSERTVGRTFQLGTGVDVSVGEIVELVGGLLGRPLHAVVDERRLRPPASEVDRLVSDPSLALELCDWRAQVGLEEGLGRTIDWVRSHPHLYRPAEYAV